MSLLFIPVLFLIGILAISYVMASDSKRIRSNYYEGMNSIINSYKLPADSGDSDAQYQLGILYGLMKNWI
jgi:hypothetical protein